MALIPRRSKPEAAGLDQTFLDDAADLGDTRLSGYRLYEHYYDGDHSTLMSDRTRRYLQRGGIRFAENFSETVIDVFAERLNITGFVLEDKSQDEQGDDQEELEQWLDGVLQRNRIDAKQRNLHSTTLIKGDGALIVDWNEKLEIPRFTFNRPDCLKFVYSQDEPDTLLHVVKKWASTAVGAQNPSGKAVIRLNLYYPDRCEKHFKLSADTDDKKGGGWARWSDEGDTDWPTPWRDKTGEPLGIPVIHFRHKPLGRTMGRSELHGVIPQNDLLNKQIIDFADILDYQAWPQRWIAGQITDSVKLNPDPGSYLTLPENATTGQFDAAPLQPVIDSIDATISRLARRSRTPMHLLIGGTTPSGEALKTAESGLLAKVEAAQTDFGQSWEDAAVIALKLGELAGKLPVDVDLSQVVAQTQWKNAATRNELAEAQRAQILHDDLEVSTRTLQAELGYDPDQEAENKKQETSTLDQAAGKLLDAGARGGMFGDTATVDQTGRTAL